LRRQIAEVTSHSCRRNRGDGRVRAREAVVAVSLCYSGRRGVESVWAGRCTDDFKVAAAINLEEFMAHAGELRKVRLSAVRIYKDKNTGEEV
jgi:hypothetical protein